MPVWPATQTRLPARAKASVGIAARLLRDGLDVLAHHLGAQLADRGLVPPAQLVVRLARIADQHVRLGGAEIARIDLDQAFAAAHVEALLLRAMALPLQHDA